MIDAPIKALAPWYGSKRTLGERIADTIGKHTTYFEPFCGSMAVLFAKQPCRHEVVNDLNRDLANVAIVIQRRATAGLLLERLHYSICSEELFRESRRQILHPYKGPLGDVDRAYHALVTWWMGRNGMAGTRASRTNFSARFTSRGGSGGVRFRNLVESIPAFTERLERVDVLNRCGFDVIERIEDQPGTAVYVDPPYIVKSTEYVHDFAAADHDRLAAAVSRFEKARVVVSYYQHEDLDRLYPSDRWDRIEHEVTKFIRNTDKRGSGAKKATEVLLVNRRAAS